MPDDLDGLEGWADRTLAELERAARIGAVPLAAVRLVDELEREAPDLAADVKAGRRELYPPTLPDAQTELQRRRAQAAGRLF